MRHFFNILLLSFITILSQAQSITSPGGTVLIKFRLDENGSPFYSVYFKGKPVAEDSRLGFVLKGNDALDRGFEVTDSKSRAYGEQWSPVWGESKSILNKYNELKLYLSQTETKRSLVIVFRAFDDGIGFRYEFPSQSKLNHFIIQDELTQFHLGADHTAFWIPGDYNTNEFYYSKTKLSQVDATVSNTFTEIGARKFYDANAVQTPLMMKTADGLYINIHEAALVNYPAMNLVIDKKTFTLNTHLVPDAVGNKAYLQTPAVTPWRTMIIAEKATGILASSLILNLNEPCAIKDVSWIKPQKMIGVWWEMHVNKNSWDLASGKHGATTANTKRYIDFAAANGFDGVLVEGWNTGWEDWYGNWKENVFDFVTPYPDYDINYLSNYARQKGVRIIMHHETSASVTNYERWMDTAYRFMKEHDINTVKTGYVGYIIPRGEWHDGQWMINHYNRVLSKAAGYQIMIDAHEPVRPTGLHRTYPNFLACEAARGNEFNAWSRGNPPEHETILPFTRLMGGPMDYTPGIFKIKMSSYDPKVNYQVHTTLTKQLALYVTFFSPLQMAADLIENYEARPDAFQFIKDVPVDWDETKYLEAEPGDYIMVARKEKGKENWFLGAITDEEARTFNTPLSFLNMGQMYLATVYRDAENAHWQTNPEAYVIEKYLVNAATVLNLKLAAGGGCAVRFTPATATDIKTVKKYKVK